MVGGVKLCTEGQPVKDVSCSSMLYISVACTKRHKSVELYRYNEIAYWLNLLSFLFVFLCRTFVESSVVSRS
jgi:hypothetical protein